MELSEDSIKIKQNVLISHKDEDSLEKHVNVQIKSELEEYMFENNYTVDSLSDSCFSDNIKIEEHNMLQSEISSPLPLITKQEVKIEIKQELDENNLEVNYGCKSTNKKELDSDRDEKLQIRASTEINHEKHCTSMKTSKLLSDVSKKISNTYSVCQEINIFSFESD
ncbi:unnamed protein product [Diabrotica balteata]|uniref:Uncharacterized protein n=1 Tax=Diabrotica balteata TaxID=107213 RepID=A0A9N9SRS7_DIABA|nr:unnamed protein product [Diabrotica balteata]